MANLKNKYAGQVAPYYGVATVWAVWAAFFDLYKIEHFIIVSILSMAVFWLLWVLLQGKAVDENISVMPEIAEKSTGDAALDKLLQEGGVALQKMRQLNRSIQEPAISANINRTEAAALNIFSYIQNNPKKTPQIRHFMDYYLPTTLKLLSTYEHMSATGISGKNINVTKKRIADMMNLIAIAFESQLDSLFGNEALDISTDITVLEKLLKQEGLLEHGTEMQISQSSESGIHLK